MELTFKNYTDAYSIKYDWEHYAYYVDETNFDITRNLLFKVNDNGHDGHLKYYDKCKSNLPFIMYLESDGAFYDFIVAESWAVLKSYTIIKLQRQQVMTIE